MDIFSIIGMAGAAFYLVGYYLQQTGRIDGHGPVYPALNLIGATLVLISLVGHFNVAAAVIQVSWIVISAVGLTRMRHDVKHRPDFTSAADFQIAA